MHISGFSKFQNLSYIADTCSSAPKAGLDDIMGFLNQWFLTISWRNPKKSRAIIDPAL